MKKYLLTFIMIFFPMLAIADASGKCGDGLTYTIDESTGTITISKTGEGTGKMNDFNPLRTYAPWSNSNYQWVINKVVIEDGITSIGSYSFSNLYNLSSIEIPNSVSFVGDEAFNGTAWYNQQPDGLVYAGKVAYKYKGTMPENTQIEIAKGTLGISDCAFENCSSLTSLTIPEGVISIGYQAFYNCRGLTSLTIPEGVMSIGNSAFRGCSNLITINFPNSITHIGTYLFDETPWYENQPNGLIYIGKIAYKYKGAMSQNSSIIIKDGTVEIYDGAFMECYGLTSVTIPKGVTIIGQHAFAYCSALTSVDIPNSVTFVGGEAFIETPWLKNQADGLIYIGKVAYKYKGTIDNKSITLKEGTTCISNGAFAGCGLSSISIPNSVTSIGNQAFYGCNKMTSVNIPNGVTSIGYMGFDGCTSLVSITLPESLKSLGEYSFSGCSSLSLVTVLASTPPICYDDFDDNAPGRIFYVPASSIESYKLQWKKYSSYIYYIGANSGSCGEDITYSFEESTGMLLISGEGEMPNFGRYNQTPWKSYSSSIKRVIIETGITSIGEAAFSECSALSSITVPISVEYISYGALTGTAWYENQPDGLVYAGKVVYAYKGIAPEKTDIKIEDGTLSITAYAFNNCNGISSVAIPNSMKTIGQSAFKGCKALTSIVIPSNVTSISGSAFEDCIGLTTIEIPENITYIESRLFAGCSNLITVTIPQCITHIAGEAFYGCSSLASIALPSNLDYIGNYAFHNCSSLTSIIIPGSVNTIGNQAFNGCSNLNSIIVNEKNTIYDSRDNCNAIIETNTNNLIVGCNKSVIPNGVSSIGYWAFYNCIGLTSISIPESVTSIDDNAFYGCTGLVSISVDKANSKYDSRNDCNAIIETATNRLILASANTIIPDGITSYSQNAFKNCVSLRLSDGLETITSNMFTDCDKLTSLWIPGSVTKIEENAFNSCTSLRNVIIEEGTKGIDFGVSYPSYYSKPQWFSACPLDSVYIGRDVKYVFTVGGGTYSYSPFREKETLRNVVFGDNVTTIPNAMFDGCSNLISVVTPEKMDSIGYSAFKGCESLSSITLPDGIRTIGYSTFYKCKSLTSINIPETVGTIDEQAFYYCEGLTKIVIPMSVNYIGRLAFGMCTNISDIEFQDGKNPLTIREESGPSFSAFSQCPINKIYLGRNIINNSYNYIYSSLASITTPFDLTISKSVTELEGGTFANCDSIMTLTFEEGTDTLTLVNDHNAYNSIMPFAGTPIDSIYMGRVIVGSDRYYPESRIVPFAGVGSSFSMRIGDNITEVGDNAYSVWKIESLYIPDNVTKIGLDAFNECTSLSYVVIEDSNTPLVFSEGSGFYHCPLNDLYIGRNLDYDSWKSPFRYNKEGLNNLVIGDQVTEITMNEFVGLKSITSLQLPANLKKIGYQAFYGCEALTTISIPNSVTKIEEDAFGLCRGLTSFIIEDGTDSLYIHNNFLNSPLNEVYLGRVIDYPEGNSPFSMLESLKVLEIGKDVGSIGDNAFAGCQNLKDVVSQPVNAPSTGKYVFTESYLSDATLHISDMAYDDYRSKYPWYLFKNIMLKDENGDESPVTSKIGDITGDGLVDDEDVTEYVNYILGNPSENFDVQKADLNGDGKVNATDLVILVDIVKNSRPQ